MSAKELKTRNDFKNCVLYDAPFCDKGISCEECDVEFDVLYENDDEWKFHKLKKTEIIRDDVIPYFRFELCCPACKRMLTDGTLIDDKYDCKNCDRCKEVTNNE